MIFSASALYGFLVDQFMGCSDDGCINSNMICRECNDIHNYLEEYWGGAAEMIEEMGLA